MTLPTQDPATPAVEGTPAAPTTPGEATPAPAAAAAAAAPVAEPTTPAPAPESEPEPAPAAAAAAPAEGASGDRELTLYRGNYDTLLQQYQNIQTRLDEYETAAMSEEERETWQLQRDRNALSQQQQDLAEAAYATDLYHYYQQFVPQNVIQGETPTDWQTSVLSHLQAEVQRLTTENQRLTTESAGLRQSVVPGATAPPVSSGGGPAAGKKRLGDMTWQEIEAMKETAIDGTLPLEDYPAVALD